MKRYRKKHVVIEAQQWFAYGDTTQVIKHHGYPYDRPCKQCGFDMHKHGSIETLEGQYVVCPGDWIIKGVKGEFYPCKSDIFEMTYEEEPAE